MKEAETELRRLFRFPANWEAEERRLEKPLLAGAPQLSCSEPANRKEQHTGSSRSQLNPEYLQAIKKTNKPL